MSPSHPNLLAYARALAHAYARRACTAALVVIVALLLPAPASAAVGQLDPTFNPAGSPPGTRLEASLPASATKDVVVDTSGRTVVVGDYFSGANRDVFVARYLIDGTLDTTFDGPSGNGNGIAHLAISAAEDVATSIAIDGTGRIIIGGYSLQVDATPFVVRLQAASGGYDTLFSGGAGNGTITLDPRLGSDRLEDLAIDGSNNIIVAGTSYGGATDSDVFVGRVDATGAVDLSFNGSGYAFIDALGNDEGHAVGVAPGGHIVVAGSAAMGGDSQILVAARTSTGGPLGTFAGTGTILHNPGVADHAHALTFHDNTLLVAGESSGDTIVLRMDDVTGAQDMSWGLNGVKIDATISAAGQTDAATGVFVDASSRVVVAGTATTGSGPAFYAARYAADGTPDGYWNGSGIQMTSFGGGVTSHGAALTTSGAPKLVIVGASSTQAAIARFDAGDPSVSLALTSCTSVNNTMNALPGIAVVSNPCSVSFGTDAPNGASLMLEHDGIGSALQPTPGPGAGIPDATGLLTANTFGVCLAAIGGGTSGTYSACASMSTGWQAVPENAQQFAYTTSSISGSATFRFGVHATPSTPAGDYVANLTFTAVANP